MYENDPRFQLIQELNAARESITRAIGFACDIEPEPLEFATLHDGMKQAREWLLSVSQYVAELEHTPTAR